MGEHVVTRRALSIPVATTSLVGRVDETHATAAALEQRGLVTLHGPGGTGKTRLAQHLAAQWQARGTEVRWVELMPVSGLAGVESALAGVLSSDDAGGDVGRLLLDELSGRDCLLVLDNCEHVVDVVAPVVAMLTRAGADVSILATSRELLKVSGEVPITVAPLATPAVDPHGPLDLQSFDGTRLFLERATALPADLTREDVDAVARICRGLDGLPLAIELAAARTRVLSVHQIADLLEDRFAILGSGDRTAAEHQQTLGASIEWSVDLLDAAERDILCRLSVFPATFDLDGATAVGGHGDRTLDLLASLVDRSLLTVVPTSGAHTYRLLESIRLYARRLLEEDGLHAATRSAHLDHTVGRALTVGGELLSGLTPTSVAHVRLLMDDVRTADQWAHALARWEQVVDLHWPLMLFHRSAETAAEVIASTEAALDSAALDLDHQARALAMLVMLTGQFGDVSGARRRSADAIDVARRHGDPFVLFVAVGAACYAETWACGDGTPLAREAVALAEMMGIPVLQQFGDAYLALALLYSGRLAECHDYATRAAERLEADAVGGPLVGLLWTIAANARLLLGPMAELRRDVEQARRATSSWESTRQRGIIDGILLPYSLIFAGRLDEARTHADDAVFAAQRRGGLALAATLLGQAIVHEADGDTAAMLEASEAAQAEFEGRWTGFWYWASTSLIALAHAQSGNVEIADALIAEARDAVPEEGFFYVDMVLGMAECLTIQHRDPQAAVSAWVDLAARELSCGVTSWNVRTLGHLADALVASGRPEEALLVLGARDAQAAEVGVAFGGMWAAHRDDVEQRARAEVSGPGGADHYANGLDSAARDVLETLSPRRGSERRPDVGWDAITRAEAVVVEQAVAGLTNAQIAKALFVTVNTIKTHLSSVYRKLGVANRAALTAHVHERRADQGTGERGGQIHPNG